MSVFVYKQNYEYVSKLLEIEKKSPKIIFSALSFISSVYFPEKTINKFYRKIDPEKEKIGSLLSDRKKIRNKSLRKMARKEIYEASAFTSIIEQGIAHEQDSSFRVFPFEIIDTLKEIQKQLQKYDAFEIAITREVLPFVFLLTPSNTVLLDVRSNYEYQQIQGILIRDKNTYSSFKDEFYRIWLSPNTINSKEYILNLIKDSINDWVSGSSIDLSKWPSMLNTNR